jgi:predicted molibdopterin-dependent oxidoreductase YjgC
MLARVDDRHQRAIRITIDGRSVEARIGDTVAAALLANDVVACRVSAVSLSPRGPYCLMGVCFECLVTIDGVGNRQGCLIEARDGMAVQTQSQLREAGR